MPLPDAPQIRELVFRRFRGEADYPHMLSVLEAHTIGHGIEYANSLEELEFVFSHLTNCDPFRDVLIAEVNGEVIAFSRVWWDVLDDGVRLYKSLGFLVPAWQRRGIGTAMLRYNERQLRDIASMHPADAPKHYQGWASDREVSAHALFAAAGYEAVRTMLEMVRPATAPLREAPLPQGLEVRPAQPHHFRAIWEARLEAYRDHWGFAPGDEQAYRRWLEGPLFNPGLWKVAWDGEQVAGMVLNRINEAESVKYGRKRGWTQDVFVRRPWRRRGLARALLEQSIEMFLNMGMAETALGVDADNPSGALALYEAAGYRTTGQHTIYRKAMQQV
ncbi:MAG: GNAT family N-acetyltransferase [Anaerolineae bacterium]